MKFCTLSIVYVRSVANIAYSQNLQQQTVARLQVTCRDKLQDFICHLASPSSDIYCSCCLYSLTLQDHHLTFAHSFTHGHPQFYYHHLSTITIQGLSQHPSILHILIYHGHPFTLVEHLLILWKLDYPVQPVIISFKPCFCNWDF